MRKILFALSLLIADCPDCVAKLWVAYTTANLNLREGPSTSYDIITQIPKEGFVFYNDEDASDGFVWVIYIDEDLSGYVSTQYIHNYQEVEIDESGQLQFVGDSDDYNPEINIKNDTDLKLTLEMNSSTYEFAPHAMRTITISPGEVLMTARAKGVTPYVGKDKVESNCIYEWTFYISTVRRF